MRSTAAGEQQASQSPPSEREALLRREVVDVDLGRATTAARRRRTWRRRRRAPSAPSGRRSVHRHAGRGLVVGERVHVDAGASATGAGWVPGSLAPRSGRAEVGGRGRRRRRTCDENSPKTRCWLRRLDQPERGDVPEHGRCRRCRARPPTRRAARTASRSPARTAPTTSCTGAWRCDVPSHVAAGRGERRPWPPGGPWTARSRSGRRAGSSSAGIWTIGAEVTVPA